MLGVASINLKQVLDLRSAPTTSELRSGLVGCHNLNKNIRPLAFYFYSMADPTRLELATSAVTGQRSNQLSYESTQCDYYNALLK